MRILVVCTGNICRSPMGEIVVRQRLADAGIDGEVESAGVSDEEHGKGVYPPARRVLEDAGYEVPARRAHRVTDAELRRAHLILAMTAGHARVLRRRCEAAGVPVDRIHLWREFESLGVAPGGCFGEGGALADHPRGDRDTYDDYEFSAGGVDVPDPWYGGHAEFLDTLAVVERGASGIVDYVRSSVGA